MATVLKPAFRVLYEGTDITSDINRFLIQLTYEDKQQDEPDELTIQLENVEELWTNEWYPTKGAKLTAEIGYEGNLVPCGTFEVDEVEATGPPDVFTIKALSAGITKKLRTAKSTAHENKTLRQIADTVAAASGLTVFDQSGGGLDNITIQRVTQNRETDLAFLKRKAHEFGYLFTIRDKMLVFTPEKQIAGQGAVVTIDRTALISYSIKDKTSETYSKAVVKYHNPKEKEVIEDEDDTSAIDGADNETAADTLEIRTKAEDKSQAKAKAEAALYRANSKQKEGSVTMPGNPLLLAGNNYEQTGIGMMSGVYNIERSSHTIDKGGGYLTSLTIKMVGFVAPEKRKTKPRKSNGQFTTVS